MALVVTIHNSNIVCTRSMVRRTMLPGMSDYLLVVILQVDQLSVAMLI